LVYADLPTATLAGVTTAGIVSGVAATRDSPCCSVTTPICDTLLLKNDLLNRLLG
jgi:hypothetical protein